MKLPNHNKQVYSYLISSFPVFFFRHLIYILLILSKPGKHAVNLIHNVLNQEFDRAYLVYNNTNNWLINK